MPENTKTHPTARVIRDHGFAKRLVHACDQNTAVPPYNYGRLTWIKEKLEEHYGLSTSVETVRKWMSGEARPRPDKMKLLAELIQVDEAWLSLGKEPELNRKEQLHRAKYAKGAISVLAGFFEIADGRTFFPQNPDECDFTVIIDDQRFNVVVSLAQEIDKSKGLYGFQAPVNIVDVTVIGAIPVNDTEISFLHFPAEFIQKHGTKKGSHMEMILHKIGQKFQCGADQVQKIENFNRDL